MSNLGLLYYQWGKLDAAERLIVRELELCLQSQPEDHPEALVVRSGIAVFLNKTGSPSFFDHEGVSQITDTAKRNGSKH